MKVDVMLYKNAAENPENVPGEWPADVITVADESILPPVGYDRMTLSDYKNHVEINRADFLAWQEKKKVAPELNEKKTAKMKLVRKNISSLLYNGFIFDGHRFRNTDAARQDFMGMLLLKDSLTWPVTIFPVAGENLLYPLTLENLNTFIAASMTHYQEKVTEGLTLETQIRMAETIEEVDAIIVEEIIVND